jgi:hypothetical protein
MRGATVRTLRAFAHAHKFSPSAWRTLKRSYNKLPARTRCVFKRAIDDNDVAAVRRLLADVA